MGEHTSGPWALLAAGDGVGRQPEDWAVTADAHDTWIAVGPTWDREHEAESRANARLIAAAPDLLEALKELLASVEGVPCGPESKCRAAIAKATGAAP